jgi:hypothetical protein
MSDASQPDPASTDEAPAVDGQWQTLPSGLKVNEDQFLIGDGPSDVQEAEPPNLDRNA